MASLCFRLREQPAYNRSGMVKKVAATLVLAGALLLALFWSATAPPRPAVPPEASAPAPPITLEYRGMAVQMQNGYNPREFYPPLIREVAALGANTILFTVVGQMEHARAQAICIDARKTPSREDLKMIFQEAKKAGLQVILMPIVLLSHPRGSEWRGAIEPPNWDDWWRQYREFLLFFADAARDGGVDVLMVGSELVSTEKETAQWVKTIELVRERFPRGKLGYSANWDHYKPIQFWNKLDLVGMTSYYTLANGANPSVAEIVSRWKPIQAEILAWQKQIGKPVILTEVGWCSQSGAATAPWNYYHNMKATPEGHEEQRRLYEAFLKVWDNAPGLSGVIWWEWTDAPGGANDFSYTPRNKPAEQLLRRWFEQGKMPTGGGATTQSNP